MRRAPIHYGQELTCCYLPEESSLSKKKMFDKKQYGVFLIIAGFLVLTIVLAALWIRRENQLADEPIDEEEDGVADVITLEEFGDYQSPECRKLHPTLKELKRQYGSGLNFVFHNLPVTDINKKSPLATQGADGAQRQGRFGKMPDRLYESQDSWKDDADPKPKFLKLAADLGLDQTRFTTDMDGEQVRFRIEADRDKALSKGITITPVIIIDGRQMKPETTTPEGVKEGLDLMFSK